MRGCRASYLTVESLDTCHDKFVMEEAVDLEVGVQTMAQFSKLVKHNLEALGSRFLGVFGLGLLVRTLLL